MSVQLTIPDSVLHQLHFPAQQVQSELQKQLAAALYSKAMISFEVGCELSGLDCWEFGELVNEKNLSHRCGRFDSSGEVLYRCSE